MSFNLLQYPALASRRRKIHRWWTSLTGLAVGTSVAIWLAGVLHEAVSQNKQDQAAWHMRLQDEKSRLAMRKVQQDDQKKWQLQHAHVQQLRVQDQAWVALHQTLLAEAGPGSAQLLRLQFDAQTLELQGRAQDVHGMVAARQRWSHRLTEHLRALKEPQRTLPSPAGAGLSTSKIPASPTEQHDPANALPVSAEGATHAGLMLVSWVTLTDAVGPSAASPLEFIWQAEWPSVGAGPKSSATGADPLPSGKTRP